MERNLFLLICFVFCVGVVSAGAGFDYNSVEFDKQLKNVENQLSNTRSLLNKNENVEEKKPEPRFVEVRMKEPAQNDSTPANSPTLQNASATPEQLANDSKRNVTGAEVVYDGGLTNIDEVKPDVQKLGLVQPLSISNPNQTRTLQEPNYLIEPVYDSDSPEKITEEHTEKEKPKETPKEKHREESKEEPQHHKKPEKEKIHPLKRKLKEKISKSVIKPTPNTSDKISEKITKQLNSVQNEEHKNFQNNEAAKLEALIESAKKQLSDEENDLKSSKIPVLEGGKLSGLSIQSDDPLMNELDTRSTRDDIFLDAVEDLRNWEIGMGSY